ncbi:MAG: thiolase family protein [Planctomycetes bacterium]|nr:thiolase family protein [Planctomycetota bacterium]
MKNLSEIVVISAVRTALGRFGGGFKNVSVHELGAKAIQTALLKAGVRGDQINETVFGNCRQAGNGPNPARTASVKGGIPKTVPAQTINMACPSAMKALQIAAESIMADRNDIVLAGGMDSMSTIPYLLKDCRWEGFKMGDKVLMDGWSDNIDPLCGYGMGMTAENLAAKYGVSREDQDKFALASHLKAAEAVKQGYFKNEIVPFEIPSEGREPAVTIDKDEVIRADTTLEKLAKLRPAFKKDGSVTAGNACAMSDGATAMVVTHKMKAKELNLYPLFSIRAFSCAAVEPDVMGEGPSVAIPAALKAAGMKISDIDLFEINEAFAVQALMNVRALEIPQEKLNIFGGAIALGHPTGISGARIVLTLYNALKIRNKEIGCAAICGAGGVAMAAVIKREC